MFSPADQPLERGWVGRLDGNLVVHLAAQTLEAFFTGGGSAREHAVYPLTAVRLLAPVLHPPAVRVFEDETSFAFANPAAIVGPEAEIGAAGGELALLARLAAVIGRRGEIAGFTACADWRRPAAKAPKDRDFALGLGPVVVTPDEFEPSNAAASVRLDGEQRVSGLSDFDWASARGYAADRTALRPGDVLAGPSLGTLDAIEPGRSVELEIEGVGALRQSVA